MKINVNFSIVLFILRTLVHFIFLIFINNLHFFVISFWPAFSDWGLNIWAWLDSFLLTYIFSTTTYTSWFFSIWFLIFILIIFNIHLFLILIILWTHTISFCSWFFSLTHHSILVFVQYCRFSLFLLLLLLTLNIFSSNLFWIKNFLVGSVHFLFKLINQRFDIIFYKFFKLK